MAGACRTASGGSGKFTTISAGASGCEARCDAHGACVAFELGPANRCELHIEAIAKAEARDGYECWARTRPTPPPADECSADFAAPQVDRDLAGELLKEVSGASAAACCAECDEVAGCEGYAYDAKWEKCYLKGPVMGTYEHAGIVARIRATPSAKPPAEPKPPTCSADWGELQKDQDLAGELIKEMSGSSEAACCDECDKVSGCEGYAYDQWKKCYLKGSVTSSYKHAGVVARMKKQPMQQ